MPCDINLKLIALKFLHSAVQTSTIVYLGVFKSGGAAVVVHGWAAVLLSSTVLLFKITVDSCLPVCVPKVYVKAV